MVDLASPDCPMCGQPSAMAIGWQWFCGNDTCPVFTWDPHDNPFEFRRKAVPVDIDIQQRQEPDRD